MKCSSSKKKRNDCINNPFLLRFQPPSTSTLALKDHHERSTKKPNKSRVVIKCIPNLLLSGEKTSVIRGYISYNVSSHNLERKNSVGYMINSRLQSANMQIAIIVRNPLKQTSTVSQQGKLFFLLPKLMDLPPVRFSPTVLIHKVCTEL